MGSALVIMPWPDRGAFRQLEQDLSQAVIQRFSTARLKICATTAVNEQGIARENIEVS